MFNEAIFSMTFDGLKDLLIHNFTLLHIATIYVLMYVIYKALGRYIYFKPHEHASKVNRTFLTLSLLVVVLHSLHVVTINLPFFPEYRWLYMACGLVIFIAPLSIITDWIVWMYDKQSGGYRYARRWHHNYLAVDPDYYKTVGSEGEEALQSTNKNIHSDILLNITALTVFLCVGGKWAYNSSIEYGFSSYIFSIFACLTIAGLFLQQSIFSWIYYFEREGRPLFRSLYLKLKEWRTK
jgi:hypothetical protein